MAKTNLFNTVIYVPDGEGLLIPLRLQIVKDAVYLLVQADKGQTTEKEALMMLKQLGDGLTAEGRVFKSFTRDFEGKEEIDSIGLETK